MRLFKRSVQGLWWYSGDRQGLFPRHFKISRFFLQSGTPPMDVIDKVVDMAGRAMADGEGITE